MTRRRMNAAVILVFPLRVIRNRLIDIDLGSGPRSPILFADPFITQLKTGSDHLDADPMTRFRDHGVLTGGIGLLHPLFHGGLIDEGLTPLAQLPGSLVLLLAQLLPSLLSHFCLGPRAA